MHCPKLKLFALSNPWALYKPGDVPVLYFNDPLSSTVPQYTFIAIVQ